MALGDLATVSRNEEGIAAVLGILKQRFGERLQTGQAMREQHGHTTTYIPNQAPDGVVWPESTVEVQEIVRVCADHRVPVIASASAPRWRVTSMRRAAAFAWTHRG